VDGTVAKDSTATIFRVEDLLLAGRLLGLLSDSDGGSMYLQNDGKILPDHAALHLVRKHVSLDIQFNGGVFKVVSSIVHEKVLSPTQRRKPL
jgi:hypothetical protein